MRKLKILAVGLVIIATMALGFQIVRIHEEFGEWRLTPSQTPPRLSLFGRSYDRSDLKPASAAPPGFVRVRETAQGAALLVEGETLLVTAPVVVYSRDDQGRVWSYALAGGP